MNKTYCDIKALLVQSNIESNEAKAIALLLMEKVCGMSTTDVLTGGDDTTRTPQEQQALDLAAQVAQGTPVQYALGEADFCGLTFHVAPGVLIPRPETEELVAWIVEDGQRAEAGSQKSNVTKKLSTIKVLDIGTGSGCIAVALAKRIEGAVVEAWDVSDVALQIAQENATNNNVNVKMKKVDVLSLLTPNLLHHSSYEIIVSNPPYICEEEKEDMEPHVLEHEPHLALFVPNDDPLLFYRRIAELGLELLRPDGRLYFEINRCFGQETMAMLKSLGYHDVEQRKDSYGNDRMVKAIKPS